MCHSCEVKHTGHYRETKEQGVACMMSVNSDCEEEYIAYRVPIMEDLFTCNICGQIFLYKCW